MSQSLLRHPQISVLIPTYNRGEYLSETLASIVSQSGPEIEVLVLDDGSTDNTAQIMAGLTAPRLRYIRKGHRGGPDTRNQGLRQAHGEWIMWVGSDDRLMSGWLATVWRYCQQYPQVDVFYGNLLVIDDRGKLLGCYEYEDFAGQERRLLSRLVFGNSLPEGGTLIRRTLIEAVGGYDPAFVRAHDYEFWTRAIPGARVKHVPAWAYQWRWHRTNMSSGTVRRDTAFEAGIVQGLLRRHSLKELFPHLDWRDWRTAQAEACWQLGRIFNQWGDQRLARVYWQESHSLRPRPEIPPRLAKCQPVQQSTPSLPRRPTVARTRPPRRVLLVAHNFPNQLRAGTENYTLDLARALMAQGCQISICYPAIARQQNNGGPVAWTEKDWEGCRLLELDRANPRFWETINNPAYNLAFDQILQHLPVDLVHFQHTYQLSLSLIEVALQRKLPVVVTLHDAWYLCPRLHGYAQGQVCSGPDDLTKCCHCLEDPMEPLSAQMHTRLRETLQFRLDYVRYLLRRCTVLAPSRYLRNLYYHHGVAVGEIILHPLGLTPFTPQADHECFDKQPHFTFLGNISPIKRLDLLLDAFKPLHGKARLEIWGNINPRQLSGFLAEIAPYPHITYQGPYGTEDLPQILRSSWATVMPSDLENYPLVARESLMAGVPVIAARTGGLPEIITDEENGLLFQPGDVADLQAKILRIMMEPDLALRLRRHIRPVKTIIEDAREHLDLYDSLLTRIATRSVRTADYRALWQEARALMENGNLREAGTRFKEALQTSPARADKVSILKDYAVLEEMSQHWAEAEALYRQALEIKEEPEVLLKLGRLARRRQRPRAAIPLLLRAEELLITSVGK